MALALALIGAGIWILNGVFVVMVAEQIGAIKPGHRPTVVDVLVGPIIACVVVAVALVDRMGRK